MVGLIWIGIYFKGTENKHLNKLASKYLTFSLQQLNLELGYQIYEDGFSYEDSVSYHGLNTEMLLLTINILDKNKINYPSNIKITTINMLNALNQLLINRKNIPLIGDIDNGRLIICDITSNIDKTDFSYLIRIAKDMNLIKNEEEMISPIKMENSGIYRMFNSVFDIIVRCGKIGLNGIGGHAHNDQLSIVLNVLGEMILIDPGTGYYSGDYKLRKLLRSTSSHNTLSIKNYEQNNIDNDLFKMKENTNSEVLNINSNSFEGRHFGFFKPLGITYKRKLELNDESLIIIDEIEKLVDEECTVNFIFDCDVVIRKIDDSNIIIRKNEVEVEFTVRGGRITTSKQYYSKSYGQYSATNKVSVILESERLQTIIGLKRKGGTNVSY